MSFKQMILIFLLVLLICFIGIISTIYVILTGIFGRRLSDKTIIRKFNRNEKLFREVSEELSSEDNIHFDRINNIFLISIHEETDGKDNIVYIEEEDFYKYEKTIKLMKKLKIKDVRKQNNNTTFLINTMFRYGQYIVETDNKSNYMKENGYIDIMENIKDNWYCAED